MALERRPVLVAFVMLLVGFILVVVVVSLLPIPAPPACYTAVCNAADVVDLVGLFLLVIGLVVLGRSLLRTPPESDESPSASPQYSFTAPTNPAAARSSPPLGSSTPSAPLARRCPACGASVTTEFGFCPRCGQSLSR